ncbi:MAG: ATP-binding cassette domain-containing protein [Oscillospiraceae bacterium]
MALVVSFSKKLENFTLNVDFTAESAATLGLLGASGSGKSMTLKCIAGIETPDKGHIELDGKILYDSAKKINLPPQQRHVGYLFQNYALFPNLTAGENIALAVPKEDRKALLPQLLAQFHLEELAEQYPRKLSGGQQQRVALARLLASRPQVLLLDEPLSALDDYLRWQVEEELREILGTFPGPSILVTHSRDEVYHLCKTACVVAEGQSQPAVPTTDLFHAPQTLSACLLSGCKNVSAATVEDGKLFATDWGVFLQTAQPYGGSVAHVGIRAHHLLAAEEHSVNPIPCKVLRVQDNLFSVVITLQTPAGGALQWELPKTQWEALQSPTTLTLTVAPENVLPLEN